MTMPIGELSVSIPNVLLIAVLGVVVRADLDNLHFDRLSRSNVVDDGFDLGAKKSRWSAT